MSDASGSGELLQPLPALPGGKRQLHLTGFMGSGKSTVAQRLARKLIWNYLDLDAVIVRHAGKTIAEIFAEEGEDAFRSLESHVLHQVVQKPRTVVALGGGTLQDAANRAVCADAAVLVWLRCSLEVIRQRCGSLSTERPLWGSAEELERRLEAREPGYRSADLTVDGSGTPEEVAEAVLAAVGI